MELRTPHRILLLVFSTVQMLAPAHSEGSPVTLSQAYESALRTSETVRIAEEGVVQSDAVIDQAYTYLYPRLNAEASYYRYNEVLPPGGNTIFQPKDDIRAGLRLTQPLYTGGRTLAALRTARTLRESGASTLSAARQDLLLQVAEVYYAVLKAQRFVEVSKDSVERLERNRRTTELEAQKRRTKANATSLLRANTLVSQARIVLRQSEDALRLARRRLFLFTGVPEDATLAEPAPLDVHLPDQGKLLQDAFEHREEYRRAKLMEKVAAENITIVDGAHRPQVSAEAALRYRNSSPSTMDEGTIYYGGIRVDVPLFEGGLARAQDAEARSRLKQSELATAAVRKAIEAEVYEAVIRLETLTSVIKDIHAQHENAKSNYAFTESLFAEGLASSLQLIDAQQALSYSEREYVSLLYDQQLAVIRLQRSLGTLAPGTIQETPRATS